MSVPRARDWSVFYVLAGKFQFLDVGIQGSQVIRRVESLNTIRPVSLFAFTGHGLTATAEAAGQDPRSAPRRPAAEFPFESNVISSEPTLWRGVRRNANWLVRHIRETLPESQGVILHCRSKRAASIGLRVQRQLPDRVRVVYDMEGVDAEERIYQARGGGPQAQLAALPKYLMSAWEEGRGLCAADRVICVSEHMRAYIRRRYGVPPSRSVCVPSTADARVFYFSAAERAATRDALGIADEPVLVYSGSLAQYQRLDLQARLVLACLEIEPRTKLLVIALQQDAAREEFRAQGVPPSAMQVVSAHYTEVRRYLNAADVGLCLRDESIVNRVASPTKIAEYLCCGLPLAVSRWTGDYANNVGPRGRGLVLAEFSAAEFGAAAQKAIDMTRRDELATRHARAEAARGELTHQAALPVYAEMYKELSSVRP